LLVGFAFGALGLALSTLMRSWQDFDLLSSAQFALFLFSATFTPLTNYPPAVRAIIEVTPLYQAVSLLRGLTTGALSPGLLVHAGYLVFATVLGLVLAGRRMGRLLLK
jgi:lipooligosaccharide transport system permease protein